MPAPALGVTVKMGSPSGNAGAAAGDEFGVTIEGIIGSAFTDTLIGNSNANALNGGGGADALTGFGGNDTLDGGTAPTR